MDWWGYSNKHGWVFLNREIPCNKPGSYNKLLFVCCKDSSIFFENRKLWDPPYYIYEKPFIDTSPNSLKEQLLSELASYKKKFN